MTVALIVLNVFVYAGVQRFQFVNWDDEVNLVSNPHFRGLGWSQLRWMFGNTLGGHYIPVTWLSFGLDYVMWGMRPAGYHATSVVLHAANAILFYLVALRLLRSAVQADPRSLAFGAAAAALLFSLHPLRVESVAWATERRDVLMGFFALLCVVAYLRAADRGRLGALHRGWYWAAVGLFGLALLSKSGEIQYLNTAAAALLHPVPASIQPVSTPRGNPVLTRTPAEAEVAALRDEALAKQWYGIAPGAWSYGLPEASTPGGRLVANPGCYATAAILAGLRKTKHRGRKRVGWMFTFAAAAFNLVRLRNLTAPAAA